MISSPGRTSRSTRTRPARRTVAMVLAGGRGARLEQLTDRRAKPAVHFGGKYRIIDFVLSGCIHSGIRRIYVATQYKSHSLLRHLQRGWSWLRAEMNEFVDLLPAQQRLDESLWYRGTADAVYQNLDILASEGADPVLVLAGDQVYRMDYEAMIAAHEASGAEVTVGCVEVPLEAATAFGVMAVDAEGRVVRFDEKPAEPAPMPGRPDRALASMGIYVFSAARLHDVLRADALDPRSAHDFGRDVIPRLIAGGGVRAHPLSASAVMGPDEVEPYWRDVGTLDAYWAANLDLAGPRPALDLFDPRWPIYTYQAQLPPAKVLAAPGGRAGAIADSLLSDACRVTGADVVGSVLFTGVEVAPGAQLDQAVVLPGASVGAGARVSRAIVDRGVRVPAGLVVGEDEDDDRRRFRRTRRGVTLVTQAMVDALG